IGAHVGDGAHEQAAGAAALDDKFRFAREFLRDEEFSGGNEIGEGVEFVAHAACIVPGFAEFAAAANVRDGEDDATVEKAEAIRTESDRHRDAVAAVPVEEKRSGAVERN